MKVKEGFIRQKIGDTEVVVAVGKKSAEFKSVITLNGSGAFLWTLLENGTDEEKMLAAMLEKYDVPASKEDEYLPIQIGNNWEYMEPHLTEEGYRAKAIFRIPSGMNGKYLMTSSQEFICFRTEEEYRKFADESHKF